MSQDDPSSGRANGREAAVPGCDSPVPSRSACRAESAGGLTGAHVGVGVDPEDRQIIAVLVDQVRERRHAYRALAANRGDAGRFVFGDDRQRAAQLLNHNGLRLDAVPLLEPNIAHLEARQRSGQRAQAAPLGAQSCQPSSRAERYRRETQEPASERSRYQRPATAATPNAGVGQR